MCPEKVGIGKPEPVPSLIGCAVCHDITPHVYYGKTAKPEENILYKCQQCGVIKGV